MHASSVYTSSAPASCLNPISDSGSQEACHRSSDGRRTLPQRRYAKQVRLTGLKSSHPVFSADFGMREPNTRIHAAGRTSGYTASNDTVAHYAKMGVRCFLTGTGGWIAQGAADYPQKAQNALS